MLNFLTFLLFVVVIVCVALYTYHLGYLSGKAEVSHIERGEPLEVSCRLYGIEGALSPSEMDELQKQLLKKFDEVNG